MIHNLIILFFALRVAIFKKSHFEARMLSWYLCVTSLYLSMKVDKKTGVYQMITCDCGMKMLAYYTVVTLYLHMMKKGPMPKRRLSNIYNKNKEVFAELKIEAEEKEAEEAEKAAKAAKKEQKPVQIK